MAGSNISKIAEGYQAQGFIVGSADSVKKQEDVQAVFATMLGQMNMNVEQQDEVSQDDFAVADTTSAVDTSTDVADSAKTQDYVASKEPSVIKKAEDNSVAVKEKAETLVDETEEAVREVVIEELSVTDEELNAVLDELGLELIDLLNPANLVQLVSRLTGAEGTDALLMSEEFVNVMQGLNGITKGLANELQVTPEELQQILSVMTEQKEQAEQFAMPDVQTEQSIVDVVSGEETNPKDVPTQMDDEPVQMLRDEQQTDAVENAEVEDTAEMQKVAVKQQSTGENSAETAEEGQNSQTEQSISVNTEDKNAKHTAFESNIAQTVNQGQAADVNAIPTATPHTETVNVADVLQQIAEFVKVSVTQNTTSLEMQLNPENLGKVYLQLSATSEGNITARLAVQNETVKEALEIQLVELRQTLNQQGVKVDAIEVTVATHEYEKNLEQNAQGERQHAEQNEKRPGRKNLNLDQLDELSGLMSEEEILVAKIMRENGNSMDVIA